jgi:2-phospho-L-lactate transferase/gluconeogenesis factor (CofD/UPF0052 family)
MIIGGHPLANHTSEAMIRSKYLGPQEGIEVMSRRLNPELN